MAVDSGGNIYIIDKSRTNCVVVDKDDKLIRTIGEGLISITDVAVGTGRVYLITPSDSRAVQVYDKNGRRLMSFEGLREGEGLLACQLLLRSIAEASCGFWMR